MRIVGYTAEGVARVEGFKRTFASLDMASDYQIQQRAAWEAVRKYFEPKEKPMCQLEVGERYLTQKDEKVEIHAIKDGRAWGRYHHRVEGKGGGLHYHEWRAFSWDANDHSLRLLPKKHKRTYWLRHRVDGSTQAHRSRDEAMRYVRENPRFTLAITGPHEIEFEEGQGLS